MKKPPLTPEPATNAKAALVLGGGLVGLIALIAWVLWPAPSYTPVPLPPPKPVEAFVMQDEKATFAQYAGSESCRACHAVEFEKWKSSHHGLAERLPNDELDLAAFQPLKHASRPMASRSCLSASITKRRPIP
jgi:hypothetical protein